MSRLTDANVLITGGTGLIFKGNGFYLTDYARKSSPGNGNGKATSSEEASSKSATPKPAAGSDD